MVCCGLTQDNIPNLLQVEEDHESDLFVSDDDDVGDRDYVQSTHSTSSDDELLPPRKEQHRRNTSTSQLEYRVSCLPDPESSDKAASGSKVRLVTRIPQERNTSVFPALVNCFLPFLTISNSKAFLKYERIASILSLPRGLEITPKWSTCLSEGNNMIVVWAAVQ